jgi:hypothetical protein
MVLVLLWRLVEIEFDKNVLFGLDQCNALATKQVALNFALNFFRRAR